MRPRFSIRLLLLLIAVVAATCYVLLVRPTEIAKRFVAAVNERDHLAAKSLLPKRDFWSGRDFIAISNPPSKSEPTRIVSVYAEILPRDWSDIWSFQRRVIFRAGFHDDRDGRHIEWTEDTQLVARFNGLKMARDSLGLP
jgi:hypothetical protein